MEAATFCPGKGTKAVSAEVGPANLANYFPYEEGNIVVIIDVLKNFDSSDCGSYYMSDADLNPVLMKCPDSLYWNSNLNVCDWPRNVDCEQPDRLK